MKTRPGEGPTDLVDVSISSFQVNNISQMSRGYCKGSLRAFDPMRLIYLTQTPYS